jgi:hypothetical protein
MFTGERCVEFLDALTIKSSGLQGQEKYARIARILDISDSSISCVYY